MSIGDKIRAIQLDQNRSYITAIWDALAIAAAIAEAEAAALVAAAYEDAAKALDKVADEWSCGHMPPDCDCARDVDQWRFAADEVRLSTPSDAQAALDAIRAERDRALAEVGPLRRMFHAIVALQKLESECNEADIGRDLPAMRTKFDAAYAEVDAALTEIARITKAAP
jgi:hypothetical protein